MWQPQGPRFFHDATNTPRACEVYIWRKRILSLLKEDTLFLGPSPSPDSPGRVQVPVELPEGLQQPSLHLSVPELLSQAQPVLVVGDACLGAWGYRAVEMAEGFGDLKLT